MDEVDYVSTRDLRGRLNAITAHHVPGRGRFRVLQEMSGISQDTWKAAWYGKQRPTAEMVQFAARRWPEYAFWLVTGVTDQVHGHRAPDNVETYPEPRYAPRNAAAKYFRKQIEMVERRDLGEAERYEDDVLLSSLADSRDGDEEAAAREDELEEKKLIGSTVQGLTEDRAEPQTLTARFLRALQQDRGWSDEELAGLLGREVEDLDQIKAGLDAQATARIFDSWGYDRLRDLLFKVLPESKAAEFRRRDIERGRRRIRRKLGLQP